MATGLAGWFAAQRGATELSTGYPIADGFLAAFGAFVVTWCVAFIVRLLNAPVVIFNKQKDDLAGLLKAGQAVSLSSYLRVDTPGTLVQFRPGNFEEMPAAIAGWKFMCQNILFTNKSASSRLSLDVTLRIRMKLEFQKPEMILPNLNSGMGRMLWPSPDSLPSPIQIGPEQTCTGTLYFWTGPMHNESIREKLSELIERDNMLPVAFLDVRNLITDEVVSLRILPNGTHYEKA
jgi:hypothetical protein